MTQHQDICLAIKAGKEVYAMIDSGCGDGSEIRSQICDSRIHNGVLQGKKVTPTSRKRVWVTIKSYEVI